MIYVIEASHTKGLDIHEKFMYKYPVLVIHADVDYFTFDIVVYGDENTSWIGWIGVIYYMVWSIGFKEELLFG